MDAYKGILAEQESAMDCSGVAQEVTEGLECVELGSLYEQSWYRTVCRDEKISNQNRCLKKNTNSYSESARPNEPFIYQLLAALKPLILSDFFWYFT